MLLRCIGLILWGRGCPCSVGSLKRQLNVDTSSLLIPQSWMQIMIPTISVPAHRSLLRGAHRHNLTLALGLIFVLVLRWCEGRDIVSIYVYSLLSLNIKVYYRLNDVVARPAIKAISTSRQHPPNNRLLISSPTYSSHTHLPPFKPKDEPPLKLITQHLPPLTPTPTPILSRSLHPRLIPQRPLCRWVFPSPYCPFSAMIFFKIEVDVCHSSISRREWYYPSSKRWTS